MASSLFYLFKDRRFMPMFLTQSFGALNDNLLKNSLVYLVTFKAVELGVESPGALVALASIAFVLPYLVFAGLAGQIADKFDKAKIVQVIKIVEIGIIAISLHGFLTNNLQIMFLCVVLMGLHSTFFGPIKYSILPEHLRRDELLAANGYVEASTFIMILFGTLLGGFSVTALYAILALMLILAISGLVSSFYIPKSVNTNPDLKINFNIFAESQNIINYAAGKKQVFMAIMGISWFWFIGAAFMTQIQTLTSVTLACDQYVANLFLATFSIGVGVGSFLCNKIFGHEIQTKYVFISCLGLSVFGFDLFFAARISSVNYPVDQLRDIWIFLAKIHNWRIIVDLFMIAMLGGIYIVPLYAVMQYFSSPNFRSRVIAANNLFNAVFMLSSQILILIFIAVKCSVTTIIFMISFINIIVAFYIFQVLPENEVVPEPLLKKIIKFFLDLFYRVEVRGIENFHKAGKRAVIVANHISYLDPPLLAVYLPERFSFAINTQIAREWWLRPLLKVVRTYSVDPTNPMAIRNLIAEVKKNKKIAIFPEGRLTRTGSLMKVYEGPGMIADKADATIIPVRVDGPQFTFFSKLKDVFKSQWFPKITITILPPEKLEAPAELASRERRKFLSQKLYDIMSGMMFESSDYKKPMFQSLIDSAKIHGFSHPIAMDLDNLSINYRGLIMRSFILGDLYNKFTKPRENVGIMLPNSVATVGSFFGLLANDRVPTMVNFSLGAANIISACKTAEVKTIFTSKKFVQKAELEDVVAKVKENVEVIFLEDIRKRVNIFAKLKAILCSYFPDAYYSYISKNYQSEKDSVGVILFTSGTEGAPKAVALSQLNLQANRCQMSARVDFGPNDIVMNALPMFHCFGLLAGCILTTLSGVRTYYYPSPLHYRIIPEVIYDIAATIVFGTDTFLNGYAKFADPYDFYSVRYIFAGAEKLKPETRKLWFDKFGVRIFEGYGVTEASPVVAVNTPMHDKPGTVGRLAPRIEAAVLSVEGISEGGRLCIRGPNVMMGYIFNDNPGVIVPPSVDKLGEGWYDTGDIVSIDEEGYVKIQGRAKRFAKIAGEMVSLASIEEIANKVDHNHLHAAVHVPDEKRGEIIILFTESSKVTRESFLQKIKSESLSEILLPKIIIHIDAVPVLSTGKINYRQIVEMAEKVDTTKTE